MKRLLLIIQVLLFCFVVAQAQSEFEDASTAVRNMKVGWNLGGSLEAHKPGVNDATQTETLRGQPVTQPELMEMMRLAGFNAVRVPITWYPHLSSDGTIDNAWMNRVQEIVDYVVNQGMYCVINVHHDTGHDASGATNKGWLRADMDNYTQNKDVFEAIWTQIANRFRDYNHLVLFEGYNELLDTYGSFNYAMFKASSYDATAAQSAYDAVNSYARSFVETVRATGGNNAYRNLIVNTYAAADGRGNWNEHVVEPLSKLEKPEQSNHIIFGVHSYPPIVEKDYDGNVIANRTMAAIQANVNSMIENLDTYFIQRYNAPVIISEWGTSQVDATPNDYEARREHMLEFADYFVKAVKEKDIAPFFWMGLSEKAYRDYPAFNQADLAETILKAYYGDDYESTILVEDNYEINTVVTFTKQYAEVTLAQSDGNLKDEYSSIEIEFAERPLGLQMSLRAYGEGGINNYVIKTVDSISATAQFSSISLNPLKRLTLILRDSGTKTVKIKHVYLVKPTGEKVEMTPKDRNSCTITTEGIPQYVKKTLGDVPYSTLYYSDRNLVVPPRSKAAGYKVANTDLQPVRSYYPGAVIPAGTPVVVNGDVAGPYVFMYTGNTGEPATGNMLRGSDADATTTGGTYYYKLGLNASDDPCSIGFYQVNSGGAAFTNAAHEAYLTLASGADAQDYYLLNPSTSGNIEVNEINFPDANFRRYVKEQLTYKDGSSTITPGADGVLTPSEIAKITTIDCRSKSIASLQGIEFFTALTSLNCNGNNLTTLVPVTNKALVSLNCSTNQLTLLNTTQNKKLEKMWCSNNLFTSIDVSKNVALNELWVVNMSTLTALDVSNNTALELLYCRDNALKELNLENNTALQILQCYGNNITALDLTKNSKLNQLVCRNNGMKSLTLPKSAALVTVNCIDNKLTEIDLSANTGLVTLLCSGNRLASLDLSTNTKLASLNYSNQSRDIIAESAQVRVVRNGQPVTEKYYYLRLDDNLTGDGEKTIVSRLDETGLEGQTSSFSPDRVTWLTGGTILNGKMRVASADDLNEYYLVGKILVLGDVTEQDNEASGTVTYNYDLQLPASATATDAVSPFTLNWTADATLNVVTGVNDLTLNRDVAEVFYTNLMGRSSRKPFNGLNIVTTRFTDGSVTSTLKMMR